MQLADTGGVNPVLEGSAWGLRYGAAYEYATFFVIVVTFTEILVWLEPLLLGKFAPLVERIGRKLI